MGDLELAVEDDEDPVGRLALGDDLGSRVEMQLLAHQCHELEPVRRQRPEQRQLAQAGEVGLECHDLASIGSLRTPGPVAGATNGS